MYAIPDGNTFKLGELHELFPDLVGPVNEMLKVTGAMTVTVFKPFDRDTEQLVTCEPYQEGNEVFTVKVEPLSADRLAEIAATKVAQENARIKAEIALLDLKRIRPLAEGDTTYLADLNAQILALRAQLK